MANTPLREDALWLASQLGPDPAKDVDTPWFKCDGCNVLEVKRHGPLRCDWCHQSRLVALNAAAVAVETGYVATSPGPE